MTPSTSTASTCVVAEEPFSWARAISEFLIRRRILLSALTFAALVAYDVAGGYKPLDLANFRDPQAIFFVLMILSGLALRSWAVGILRKDAELTTTGPYRLIRNPLYVGSFLMMFGFCGLIGNPMNLLFVLGPVLLIYVVKVRHEERLLASRFSAEWSVYSRRTPRFLPRLAPADLTADWKLSQWLRSREYHALVATLVALVALKIWHQA